MRRIALAGQMGDTEALRRADNQTREHLTNATSEEPWWTLWLGPSAVDAQTGRALLAANRPDLAEPYLSGRTPDDDAGYPRDRMLFASELASARGQIGDVAGAVTSARQALALSRQVGSDSCPPPPQWRDHHTASTAQRQDPCPATPHRPGCLMTGRPLPIQWDIHAENVADADGAESLLREILTRTTDCTSDGRPVNGAFAVWCAPAQIGDERPEPAMRVDLYPPDARAALRWLPTGQEASEPGITSGGSDLRVLVAGARPSGYETVPAARWRVTLETAILAVRQYVSSDSPPHCVDWS